MGNLSLIQILSTYQKTVKHFAVLKEMVNFGRVAFLFQTSKEHRLLLLLLRKCLQKAAFISNLAFMVAFHRHTTDDQAAISSQQNYRQWRKSLNLKELEKLKLVLITFRPLHYILPSLPSLPSLPKENLLVQTDFVVQKHAFATVTSTYWNRQVL